MPPPLLFDPPDIDFQNPIATREQIYEFLPHRFEFMQLDGIAFINDAHSQAVGFRDIREDEFWVKGHIPGRPIFPGVLMLESAAHLASYVTLRFLESKDYFFGFGGLERVKFRGAVEPGARVVFLTRLFKLKSRQVIWDMQALHDDRLIFEGQVIGILM